MTSSQIDPAAQAWLEASSHKSVKPARRRIMETAVAAVCAYLGLEIMTNPQDVLQLSDRLFWLMDHEAFPEPAVHWDFTAGIEHSDATTIVGSLAAVVVTINVAVFAARLGGSPDLRGEMDISRWQKVMERLAPLSAVAALAVAGTRFPAETGLGAALVVVAIITLGASDVRIARRLGALNLDAEIAVIQSLRARDRLDRFRNSLPGPVQARIPLKLDAKQARASSYSFALLTGLFFVMLLFILNAERDLETARSIRGSLLAAAATGAALIALGGLTRGRLMRAVRVDPVDPSEAGSTAVFGALELLVLTATPVFVAAVTPEQVRPVAVGLSFAVVAAKHALNRVGRQTGRGPGAAIVWSILARLTLEADLHVKKSSAARDERDAEMRLHAALDAAALERSTKPVRPDRVPTQRPE